MRSRRRASSWTPSALPATRSCRRRSPGTSTSSACARCARGSGRLAYAPPDAPDADGLRALGAALRRWALDFQASGNILVVLTPRGYAAPLADAIDASGLTDAIGTVAGDNTIIVVAREGVSGAALADELRAYADGRSGMTHRRPRLLAAGSTRAAPSPGSRRTTASTRSWPCSSTSARTSSSSRRSRAPARPARTTSSSPSCARSSRTSRWPRRSRPTRSTRASTRSSPRSRGR